MAGNAPHDKTLFHLVPTNAVACEALLHPDNKRFVSQSAIGLQGLEVGFHVPRIPSGHVIARLGRNADLLLSKSSRENPMSSIHVAFEINPATHVVVLSVRSKRVSSVKISMSESSDGIQIDQVAPRGEIPAQRQTQEVEAVKREIIGDGVILYGQKYTISIAAYTFQLIWPPDVTIERLKSFTVGCYEESLQRLKDVASRDRPTECDDTETQSWYITRLNTAQAAQFRDMPQHRKPKGEGAFGTVYKSVDAASGNIIAVKVVKLNNYGISLDAARSMLHKEIKIMQRVKHPHIVEYLGMQNFHTSQPEIFMPLKDGSLTTLIEDKKYSSRRALFNDVLMQVLSALDYLDSEKLVHRDLKPDNILYHKQRSEGGSGFHFQLADFGLAHHQSLARTNVGTYYYQAPELYPHESRVQAGQSGKMDVWSLFATMVAVESRFKRFPVRINNYTDILNTLLAQVPRSECFEPMARLDPNLRASAAQMLNEYFDGWGLTTRRSRIPPIQRDFPAAPGPAIAGPAGPSNPRRAARQDREPAAYIEPPRDRRRATTREPAAYIQETPAQDRRRAATREPAAYIETPAQDRRRVATREPQRQPPKTRQSSDVEMTDVFSDRRTRRAAVEPPQDRRRAATREPAAYIEPSPDRSQAQPPPATRELRRRPLGRQSPDAEMFNVFKERRRFH